MRTILTPASTALSRAGCTCGPVGVTAIPLTPCATIDSMRAICALVVVAGGLPWPVISSTSGWSAAHALAASSMVKKKSTGNFVMSPSLIFSAAADAGADASVVAAAAVGLGAARPSRSSTR